MKKLFLLFNTLRYLKWQQVYFRILRKLIKPKVTDNFEGSNPKRPIKWIHHTLYESKINDQFEASYLNYKKKLDLPLDWNKEFPSKLWVYNLHYFEELLSVNAKEKHFFHQQLLNLWVDQNPIGSGNGWEPYPTSLRIVNILKAWLGGMALDKKLFKSIFVQTSFLSNNLEKHLLGNHYFVNLKALLFAGVIFNNARWLHIAEKGLISEIGEQVLEDGANFELSPMYHSLMLVDMLDIYNLSNAYPLKISTDLVNLVEKNIPKMLKFMQAMSHPDGDVSFFNDSSIGIAPTKLQIESYSEKLGFKTNHTDLTKTEIIDNFSSGYICAISNDSKLIFDAAAIGPDYIPGHAHADTLSFELSIGTQRTFVNSGTSEYGLSLQRLNQRKTASHNTVEVDGIDSTQVWSGFRVADRAKIISRDAVLNVDKGFELIAAHNGYKRMFGGCIHERRLSFNGKRLKVSDQLKGRFKYAKSRFYFHPNLKVKLENNLLTIEGEEFILQSYLKDKSASIMDSVWHPEFGKSLPNKMLEVNFIENHLSVEFNWSKK